VVQAISALKYLHAHRVIHRDLKLGNLFLTDKMEEKIGDFGLATKLEFEGDRKRTICGTPNYIAPEILDGKQGHSYEVDIWSLGVIIYTLLIGKPPFETSDVKTTYKRIRVNAYTFPDNITISDQARGLITKILNLDPTKRPTLDEILEHPFFCTGGAIPKLLPASTLACPPSASYVRQFMPNSLPASSSGDKQRLESTTPVQLGNDTKTKSKPTTSALQNTEKLSGKLAADPASSTSKPATSGGDAKKDATTAKATDKKSDKTVGPSVWVKKWVDYTSKYGLGYWLTNGSTGVFFNDSTKIILDSLGQ
jgi:polo-like kinase 1